MTVARSVADVLDEHVVFEVESIDRMYLNVWQPRLAYGGGVQGFFVGHRGHHYASTALMDPMTKTFVTDIHGFIAARGLELVSFAKGQRKDDLTQQYLARFTDAEGVLFVGRAQEKAGVWRTQWRYNPVTGGSYAWPVRSSAFINFFYFYCVDADFGPFFIKFSTYFPYTNAAKIGGSSNVLTCGYCSMKDSKLSGIVPYTAKLCVNGNEWAKRQAVKAGIGFEALDNGFAAVEDAEGLQRICDSFGSEHLEALLRKWLAILPNGSVASVKSKIRQAWSMRRRSHRVPASRSSFAGFRFPPDVITLAVRWYLRYGLSYRDVEELLAERGITVDHVTIYRWVQRFTPPLIDVARSCRHTPGDRWFVDETYVKVAGRWIYLYRAIDQFGQVIDVLVSERRDRAATRRFFTRALEHGPCPAEVNTDRAPAYPRVLDELLPSACHIVEQYANNPVEADHGRLKSRLRPMRGLKRLRSARVISAGHAFVQNLRRGHYELGLDVDPGHRLSTAFAELTLAI